VIRRVLAEHARLAVDPNTVAGTDESIDRSIVVAAAHQVQTQRRHSSGGAAKPALRHTRTLRNDTDKPRDPTLFTCPDSPDGLSRRSPRGALMGRPDILEKNCHSTCPKSMIETTKIDNPNMVVDILAIPPRKDPGDVCCKWRFSMRTEDDPAYVPVELIKNPRGNETRRSD
jgi:hypothetical protein